MRQAVIDAERLRANKERFLEESTPDDFKRWAEIRMAQVDALPPAVRRLVHEYDFYTVIRLVGVLGPHAPSIEREIRRERAERDHKALMEDMMEVELVL